MSITMPFQPTPQMERIAKARLNAAGPVVQDEHPLNRKPIIFRVPLDGVPKDEVALKHARQAKAQQETLIPKPQPTLRPLNRREIHQSQPEQDILQINHRPTQARDLERAQATMKKNRTIRNIGIFGLTGIGVIAVTFAALKTYLWGDK